MNKLDELVKGFLAQKHVAVVGVSDRRETGCNLAYERFKQAGYRVSPVNPRLDRFNGEPCFGSLRDIPEKPDAVFILAKPAVTEQIVQECIQLGIKHVWMHCMMGVRPGLMASASSVSAAAVQACHENGIVVIPGSCPNQYLYPDGAHKLMRGLWGLLGFLKLTEK